MSDVEPFSVCLLGGDSFCIVLREGYMCVIVNSG